MVVRKHDFDVAMMARGAAQKVIRKGTYNSAVHVAPQHCVVCAKCAASELQGD